MRVTPAKWHVLITRDKVEEVTEGGIVLPHQAKNKEYAACQVGTIKALGSEAFKDKPNEAMLFPLGAKVIFTRYSGVAVDMSDPESDILINDTDILALVEEK